MAINKNFVIKHGVEVSNNLIYADPDIESVGIGTTVLNHTLEVNGGIGATNLNVSGIATITTLVATSATITNLSIGAIASPTVAFSTITATNAIPTNLDLTSSTISIGGSVGSNGQYLVSTGSGVNWITTPTARTSTTIIAAPAQTSISYTYTVGLVDVYINGVKLSPSEFTADDGVTITLNQACFGGESIEVIAYAVSSLGAGTSGIQGITIQNQGITTGTPLSITSLNFVGASVTAVNSGVGVTVYISDNVGTISQWETTDVGINTLSSVGIGTTSAGEKLQVDGNIRVGISTTSNYIAFRGTSFDGPFNIGGEQLYQHTYIGERIYDYIGGIGERSELLLFKGNDIADISGPDRIRLFAGEHRFDVLGFSTTGTFEEVGVSTAAVNKLTITSTGVGIGTTNPTSALTVVGSGASISQLYVTGVSTFSSGAIVPKGQSIDFGDLQIFTNTPGINNSATTFLYTGSNDFQVISDNFKIKTTSGFYGSLTKADFSGAPILYYVTASSSSERLQITDYGVKITGLTSTTELSVSGVSTFSGNVRVGVDTSSGVILTSPNGTQYRLIVDDSGTLSTVAV